MTNGDRKCWQRKDSILNTYMDKPSEYKKKLESHSAIASCDSYASFVLSNLPRASITPWLHAARLPFLKKLIHLFQNLQSFLLYGTDHYFSGAGGDADFKETLLKDISTC